jgi:hypothetical protein
MNSKKAKLIRRVAEAKKGNYNIMKKNYISLARNEKEEVSKKMRILLR